MHQLVVPSFIKPLIMGIVNVTADSFSDGGRYLSPQKACEHALQLIEEGADIIDIGGESTKPGASPVGVDIELERVIPVIERIRSYSDVVISIDTYKPAVMSAAVHVGANMINDVFALRQEGALATAAELAVPVCIMHMQGIPLTMQERPSYPQGVLAEIISFLQERITACAEAGIDKKNLIIDPGFGFGKSLENNLNLVYNLNKIQQLALPILMGFSRKSSIGSLLNKRVEDRLIGGLAFSVFAAMQGVAILRTHDVDATKQAMDVIAAIYNAADNNNSEDA